jgi:hypothetical protein
MATPELLPCPFCGAAASFGWFVTTPYIRCGMCRFEMDGDVGDEAGSSVVEKWNRRAPICKGGGKNDHGADD